MVIGFSFAELDPVIRIVGAHTTEIPKKLYVNLVRGANHGCPEVYALVGIAQVRK